MILKDLRQFVVTTALAACLPIGSAAGYELIVSLADGPPGHPFEIQRLNQQGQVIDVLPSNGVPISLGTDHVGNIYLVNFGSGTIHKHDRSGAHLAAISAPPVANVVMFGRLVISPEGEIAALARKGFENSFNAIERFDSSGDFLGEIVLTALMGNYGLVLDPVGNYATWSHGKLLHFSPVGELVSEVVSLPDGSFDVPPTFIRDIAIDELGNSFFLTGYRIHRFDSTGVSLGAIASLQGEFWTSIEIDSDGNLLVGGAGPEEFTANGFIRKFTIGGVFLGDVASGLLGAPIDFALDYSVPEPATAQLVLFGLGLAAIFLCRRFTTLGHSGNSLYTRDPPSCRRGYSLLRSVRHTSCLEHEIHRRAQA
jgi:hypothetical protein